MRMDNAVIHLHRFLPTFNTMEIEYMIGKNTIMLVLMSPPNIPYIHWELIRNCEG